MGLVAKDGGATEGAGQEQGPALDGVEQRPGLRQQLLVTLAEDALDVLRVARLFQSTEDLGDGKR
jgi:hypothetical protein